MNMTKHIDEDIKRTQDRLEALRFRKEVIERMKALCDTWTSDEKQAIYEILTDEVGDFGWMR